jgi:hypothetical protein
MPDTTEKPADWYTLRDLVHEAGKGALRPSLSAEVADALYTAGVRPPVAAAPRTAIGQPADETTRQGMIARAVHTIPPEKIAEHGETVLLAWIQQSIRELAQAGADPFRDVSLMIVGMQDGTVVVTGEARVTS